MSTFNNNLGPLSSNTKPKAFLEIALVLAALEARASTTENPLNSINVTFDAEARTSSIAATVPISASLNPAGQVVIQAENYLGADYPFSGNGGDLKATSYPGAFLEMAQIVAAAEKAVTVNQPNNVTISFDLEGGIATVTAALPISININANGEPVVVATDYLPTQPS